MQYVDLSLNRVCEGTPGFFAPCRTHIRHESSTNLHRRKNAPQAELTFRLRGAVSYIARYRAITSCQSETFLPAHPRSFGVGCGHPTRHLPPTQRNALVRARTREEPSFHPTDLRRHSIQSIHRRDSRNTRNTRKKSGDDQPQRSKCKPPPNTS